MARSLTLAEAVKDELNGQSWTQGFTATREYRPIYTLGDTETLTVAVVPVARETEELSRAADQKIYEVQVGIMKKFSDEIECDGLLDLCEEIADYFRKKMLGSEYFCIERMIDPLFDGDLIIENRQFASVITLKFKVLG